MYKNAAPLSTADGTSALAGDLETVIDNEAAKQTLHLSGTPPRIAVSHRLMKRLPETLRKLSMQKP